MKVGGTVVALLFAAGSATGCVSYDPQPVTHPSPPVRGESSRASSAPVVMQSPTTVPTSINEAPTVVWVKVSPDPFNPQCEPGYSAAPVVTAHVADPDTPPGELRVTVSWFGAKLQGERAMTYDPRTQLFTATLPRMYAKDIGVDPAHVPQISVDVIDPRNEMSRPFAGYATNPFTCGFLGLLTNHA